MKKFIIILTIIAAASASGQTLEKDYYLYLRKQDSAKHKVDSTTKKPIKKTAQ